MARGGIGSIVRAAAALVGNRRPRRYADGGEVDTERVFRRERISPAFDPFTYGEGGGEQLFFMPLADEPEVVPVPVPVPVEPPVPAQEPNMYGMWSYNPQSPITFGNRPAPDYGGGAEGRGIGGMGSPSMHDIAAAYSTAERFADPFGWGFNPVSLTGTAALRGLQGIMDREFERQDADRWGGGIGSDVSFPDIDPTAAGSPYAKGGLAHGSVRPSDLARYAARGRVRGAGAGQDDKIPAMLSDGEYVLDAAAVADIGDGSNDEGARRLDAFRRRLRSHKRGASPKSIPPKAKGIGHYMRGGR